MPIYSNNTTMSVLKNDEHFKYEMELTSLKRSGPNVPPGPVALGRRGAIVVDGSMRIYNNNTAMRVY